jgi:hypothetical protein
LFPRQGNFPAVIRFFSGFGQSKYLRIGRLDADPMLRVTPEEVFNFS